MRPSTVTLVLVALCLVATLCGPTMVHAEGGSVPGEDTTTNDITREGQDNRCSPLQKRQELLDNRVNGLDTRLNGLNEVDTHTNTRLNGMDARLNRMDGRFDNLETAMSDMKEYLRQRMDAMEVKVEWALAGTKQTTEVTTPQSQPTMTSQMPKDCQEAYTMGSTSSGIYTIAPKPNMHIDVYCEQQLLGGGWTVFQVRKDGSMNFYRDWNAYEAGFGELSGEFWLGNTNIHLLSQHQDQELKIELTSAEGEVKYANYGHFSIGDQSSQYTLNVTGYSGGRLPGDSMGYNNGVMFSTKDADHDGDSLYSYATMCQGAWWYQRGGPWSNLNGPYGGSGGKGMWWYTWLNYTPLKATRMMMRKKP